MAIKMACSTKSATGKIVLGRTTNSGRRRRVWN